MEKSTLETGRICAHFGECGGCAYLSMCGEDELRLKGEQIKRLLSSRIEKSTELFGFAPEWDGIKASPVMHGYRNKMEFTFGNEIIGGPLNVGLHKRGAFHDILDVSDCLIVDEDFRKILVLTRDFFRDRDIPFYHRKDHSGYLRNLMVRKAAYTGEILVCPVTASADAWGRDDSSLLKEYCDCLASADFTGMLAGVVHIICDSLSDAIIADRTELLYGRDHINEKLLGMDFRIGPFSFFQTNTHSAEVLYLLVRDAKNGKADDENTDSLPMIKCIGLIIIGLALIIAGGKFVVESAKELARMAGMTETLIGVTIVAAGTSLPELVTSIVAARKGETGLAIGNVVGSNIFNLLFILGISGTISPMAVNLATITDFVILILCSILTYIFSRTYEKIVRWEGLTMVILYIAYVGYAILRR